jgi:cytosine/adenosine deaminase-related metal-dependent hydrolase
MSQAPGSTLVLHLAPAVMPVVTGALVPSPPVRDGAVAVQGGTVVAVGTAAEGRALAAAHAGPVVERAWDGVLLPGLVNAHTHLQYSGYGELAGSGLPFPAWIAEMMRRRQLTTDDDWAAAAAEGASALLRTGTTCVADVATDSAAVDPVRSSGLGGLSYLEAVGWDEASWQQEGRRAYRERVETALAAGDPVGVMPHAPYTLDRTVMAEIVATGRAAGLRTHTHLAESDAETEYVATGTGRFAAGARAAGWDFALVASGGCGLSPAGMVAADGWLDDDVHVAHGVHLDADDRAMLRARGVVVALCTRSNAILQSGEAPVAAYLHEGSPVALGTDSLASSPSLDLLDEARATFDLARRQGYAGPDLAARLVHAATLGGARAMGLHRPGAGGAPRGGLYPGARADLAVIAVDQLGDDPASDVVATGRAVATVLGGTLLDP